MTGNAGSSKERINFEMRPKGALYSFEFESSIDSIFGCSIESIGTYPDMPLLTFGY